MKRLANKPFALLGINSDADREELKKIILEKQITWRSWWDRSPDGPIQTQWQVPVRPTIHILDAKGVIRHMYVTEDELDKKVDLLLKELADATKR